MQNKLQELTDRLYNEGLSKGRQEADQLLAKARQEAQAIVAQAREEAESIRAAAEKQAAETRTMVEGDLKMASTQAGSASRQQVENMVITKAVANPVGAALSDSSFVQELIATVVKAFNAANPDGVGLDVILPESKQNALEQAFTNEAVKNLSKESKMVLLSVTTDNPNLRFDAKNVGKTPEPEESVTLPFTVT